MLRVWVELGSGRITEGFLSDRKHFTDGITYGNGHITINPAHQTCDTVIHEILHRLHPQWSERYVRRTTTYLRRRMTDAETMAFYDEYQRRVKKRKRRLYARQAKYAGQLGHFRASGSGWKAPLSIAEMASRYSCSRFWSSPPSITTRLPLDR